MSKHWATSGITAQRPQSAPLVLNSGEGSDFFKMVEGKYGSVMGHSIAQSAERNLDEWGINPRKLKLMPEKGNNSILFSMDGKLAVKVTEEVETYRQSPLGNNPLVLKPYCSATIGFDMGDVPIVLEVFPQLNTQSVEPRHVQALCHDLYTKYGLVFRDNKLENVGLTEEGVPYVIDRGSITHIRSTSLQQNDYLYPELSGFNADSRAWSPEAGQHGFIWPESQGAVHQFRAAASLMKPRSVSASVS